MKKISNLTVTVKYTVGLIGVEVPDDVFEGMSSRYNFAADLLNMSDEENAAFEWLADNIEERDAMEWECEVDEMEEDDEQKAED